MVDCPAKHGPTGFQCDLENTRTGHPDNMHHYEETPERVYTWPTWLYEFPDDEIPPASPVGVDELRTHLSEHEQVPEVVVDAIWEPRQRRRVRDASGCAAHSEGQHCCLDYFHDTITRLLGGDSVET